MCKSFINLFQGCINLREYSLKFTQLSKHAPTIVADSTAKLSKFVAGVSDMLEKECRRISIIICDMDM